MVPVDPGRRRSDGAVAVAVPGDRVAGVTARAIPVRHPYNLLRTLQCGQAFRWRVDQTGASGIFSGRQVRLQQTAHGITVEGLSGDDDLGRLQRHLGVDEPLAAIEAALGRDRVLQRILPQTSGIALMRQDPWECLVSFIVSAFNNIPKIELSLDRLTRHFGHHVAEGVWTFPAAARLAAVRLSELRGCALGYRAPYVRAVARLVAAGDLDLGALGRQTYEETFRALLALPGVGEKVADCVLLFAFGKGEAFPVDVWVRRAVERWYFHGRRKSDRQIRAFARTRFGRLAGYAQQHLFYYARTVASLYASASLRSGRRLRG